MFPTTIKHIAIGLLLGLYVTPLLAQTSISGNPHPLAYTENNTTVVDGSISIVSASGGKRINSGYVQVISNYLSDEDTLLFLTATAINNSWVDASGRLNFTKGAKDVDYQAVFQDIRYYNKSDNPDLNDRVIEFSITDGNGTTVTFSRTITITRVNDAPWLYDTSTSLKRDTIYYTATEDQVKNLCPTIFDAEGDSYEISIDQIVNGSGTVSLTDNATCLSYTPNANFFGSEYIKLTLSEVDNPSVTRSGTIALTVENVNDRPVIVENGVSVDSIYATTDINTPVTVCIDITDIESNTVAISSITPPQLIGSVTAINGLCFDYLPNLDAAGTEYLEVIACETGAPQLCDTVIVELQFPSINTAPEYDTNGEDTISQAMLIDQTLTQLIAVTDRERDNITLDTFYVVSGNGTLDATLATGLSYSFTPVFADSLTSTALYFKVCDDRNPSLCSELVINVSLNYPPVLRNQEGSVVDSIYIALQENTLFNTTFSLADLNGNTVFNQSISPTDSLLSASVTGQQIQLTYTSFTDFQGLDEYTLTMSDNGVPAATTSIPIVFELFPTNYKPVFSDLEAGATSFTFEIDENTSLDSCLTLIDNEGDGLSVDSFQYISGPGELIASLQTDALCLAYTSELNQYGTYEAEVTICDDNRFPLCTTVGFVINLAPVNADPILANDSATLTITETLILDLLANDSDPENEGLYIDAATALTEELGVLTIESDNTIQYVPDPDEYKGTDEYEITVCDNGVPQSCLTSTLKIKFELPTPPLQVYEAFSPNGDNINDTWFIDGIREYPDNHVIVRDQFNNVIYDVKGYDNKTVIWTGTSSREPGNGPAKEGTYYYVIDLGDGSKALTGFVVLKR